MLNDAQQKLCVLDTIQKQIIIQFTVEFILKFKNRSNVCVELFSLHTLRKTL